MDECDFEAEHALPRRLVDQLGAGIGQVRERGADVVHLVRDVMHPGAPLREKTTDRRVVAEGAQQLEPALSDPDRRGLDALLLDTRAVLEPGTEQALVRLESPVEVVDGEPDVMDGARRIHPTIVFERLAATMRVPALALILAAVLLAGCGSSHQKEQSNGEASKPANQVLANTKAAATSASSAHVSGSIVSGGTPIKLDLTMARDKGAKGSMSTNGLSFNLVRIGDTLYIQGTDEFYKHFAGAAVAQLLHGRWLKASATQGQLKSLAPLTNIGALFAGISANHGKLENKGATAFQGQRVVEIRDTSDNSKLYVAATGKPYPVAIVGGKKNQSGTISFDDWNAGVSLSAPKNALDISQLGGG
jgi:hypothetical protein